MKIFDRVIYIQVINGKKNSSVVAVLGVMARVMMARDTQEKNYDLSAGCPAQPSTNARCIKSARRLIRRQPDHHCTDF